LTKVLHNSTEKGTEITIYDLPIATKISSVLELWPWLEAIQQQ